MNEIRVKRMLLAGLAMFVVWVALEILLEHVLAKLLFGETSAEMWRQAIDVSRQSGFSPIVNILIAVVNCTILIWLYASLRPMYGVGGKTVLITSAFFVAWMLSFFFNLTNLGLLPARLAMTEALFEFVEFPIAMFVGAGVYEGNQEEAGSRT